MSAARKKSTKSPSHESGKQTQPGTVIFTGTLHRVRRGNGHTFLLGDPPDPPQPVHKPARVARMLAFAHKLKQAIARGEYKSRADAARRLGLTRARISQLLDLTLLAPDIQEQILFLERVDGVEPVTERGLREVISYADWEQQQKTWLETQPEGQHDFGRL